MPTIAFHGDTDALVPYTGGGMFGYLARRGHDDE
jgi:poly(3-hydroxybutyrate) depolymerase